MPLIFLGDDWSSDHHDVELQDDQGRRLSKRRLDEGVAGLAEADKMSARQKSP